MRKYWAWTDVNGIFQVTVSEQQALAVVAEGIKVLEINIDMSSAHGSVMFASLERITTFNRKMVHIGNLP